MGSLCADCHSELIPQEAKVGYCLGCLEASHPDLYAQAFPVKSHPRLQATIKAETEDAITVAGWLVVYGGEDLYGTRFTRGTDFWLDRMGTRKAVLYDHGLDDVLDLHVLGQATVSPMDDGLWCEAQLSKHDRYVQKVQRLIEQGVMGWSSGSVSHMIRSVTDPDGIERYVSWPVVDASLTVTPAEPRTLGVHTLRALTDLVPSLKSYLPEEPAASDSGAADGDGEDRLELTIPTSAHRIPALPISHTHEPSFPEGTASESTDAAVKSVADSEETHMPDAIASPVLPTDEQIAGLLDQRIADAVKAALENAPAFKTAPYVVPYAVKSQNGQVDEVKTFDRWLRVGGQPYRAYKAAMQEGTDGEGGYLVPTQLLPDLVKGIQSYSVLRRAGATQKTVSWWKASQPTLTDSGAAVLTAEEGSYDEAEPTLGTIALQQYKFTRIAKASEEQIADQAQDIWVDILQPDFAQAFAKAENSYFTKGTGSSQPQGFLVGGTAAFTTAGATAITADEVIDLYYALPEAHRLNAVWMANDSTFKFIRKLKDGNGDYLWERAFNGQPSTIMGRPVITNPDMDAIAASKKVLAFGDFSYFRIYDRQDLQVQRLNELYAANGQVGFRAFKRNTSAVVLATAIQYMTTHA